MEQGQDECTNTMAVNTLAENVVLDHSTPCQPQLSGQEGEELFYDEWNSIRSISPSSNSRSVSPDNDDASLFSWEQASTPCTSRSASPGGNSSESTGWDSSSAELPEDHPSSPPPPPKIVIYFEQASFKTRHYFFKWLQTTLEALCFNFGKEWLFRHQLEDQQWKDRNLKWHLQNLRWTEPGRIELDIWANFLDDYILDCPFPKRIQASICQGAVLLRNAAVHRLPLDTEALEDAMLLPEMLGDPSLGAKIKAMYDAVCDYPNLDAEYQLEIDRLLYPEQKPPVQPYELLQRIQAILEPIVHDHARLSTPEFLTKHGIVTPEQMELQAWQDLGYGQIAKQVPSSLDEYPDPKGLNLSRALHGVRELRNKATHRTPTSNLGQRVEWAKELAVLLGDRGQAENIQKLADEWLLKFNEEEGDGSYW